MKRLKLFIFISLALAVAAVSLGIDRGICTQKQKGNGSALQTEGKMSNVTPSQKNITLSKRNQMMLEQAEWAKIRRENILKGR